MEWADRRRGLKGGFIRSELGDRSVMGRRSDFAQKLLDDLRLRKERMGLLPPDQRSSSSPAPVNIVNASRAAAAAAATATKRSNFSSRKIQDTNASKTAHSHGQQALLVGGSNEIVPYGKTRSREHTIDLSMALALALSNSGKLQNIEILGNPTVGRRIVLHMDGNMPRANAHQLHSLSPSQIGDIAGGIQNLNMIIRACSNGFNLSRRESMDIGRELLKGAMGLEESLRMLVTLQDASDYMVGQGKPKQFKLLKGQEEDDEPFSHGANQRKLSTAKYTFIRDDSSDNAKSRFHASNSRGISSNSYTQFVSNHRSKSCGPCAKSESRVASNDTDESGRLSNDMISADSRYNHVNSKGNSVSEKVRIPNIIAKLMGLEELAAPTETKKTEMNKSSRSPQVKNKIVEIDSDDDSKGANRGANPRKKMTRIDAQDKILQDQGMTKNNLSKTNNRENKNLASNSIPKASVSSKRQIDVNIMNHKKEATSQEEFKILNRQQKGKMEDNTPAVGKTHQNHTDETSARIKEMTIGRDGTAVKKQEIREKPEDTTLLENVFSNYHQKSSFSGSNVSLTHMRKLILKTEGNDPKMSIIRDQSSNEKNNEPVQKGIIHSLQSEQVKEPDSKSKLQFDQTNKRVAEYKDFRKTFQEQRNKGMQTGKVTAVSNRKGLSDKTSIRPSTENQVNHNGKANVKYKSAANFKADDKLTTQSLDESVAIKRHARNKKARSLIQAMSKRQPTQIQSAQKMNVLKAGEDARLTSKSSVEGPVRQKVSQASQDIERKSSIFEELETRWEERNKKAIEEKAKISNKTSLGLDLQHRTESTSSGNLPAEDDNNEMTITNLVTADGKTITSSSNNAHTTHGSIPISTDQPISEVIMLQDGEKRNTSQISESTDNNNKSTAECFQQSSKEDHPEPEYSLTENKRDWGIEQREALTKEENDMKCIFINSQNFLNIAHAIFQIKIPVDILQASGSASMHKDSKLFINCGCELMRRKGEREELTFARMGTLEPAKIRSLDSLTKELHGDLINLKYPNYIEGDDHDLAERLNKMIEKDIQNRKPDINSSWDFGWDSLMEKDEIVRDVEKHVVNTLLNELTIDILNVRISN
ncbi:hypothetical protein AXF42_Ash019138 [Apostasia shenzhenica]|uniref:DUF3741 domain-containing protein n=1 Tax=Apostasia shenzhenica TaxID=1088818 RepID=A0A2I0B2C6_9ASPA|nr:hypothetical protein AXF42_Ash019138 [Apostasia shenzhenica]